MGTLNIVQSNERRETQFETLFLILGKLNERWNVVDVLKIDFCFFFQISPIFKVNGE